MSTKEGKLAALTVKQNRIVSQINRFATYVESFADVNKLTELQIRLSSIESLLEEFTTVLDEIEIIGEKNYEAERVAFEDVFYESTAKARQIVFENTSTEVNHLQADSTANNNQSVTQNSAPSKPNVRLPTFELPQFDGSYDEYLNFAESFRDIIDKNPTITNIQRLQYLKMSLKGNAARVIHSLPITEGNYEIAWNLIRERYQNERIIVFTHVKAIVEIPTLHKESHSGLRGLLDELVMRLRALETLQQPTSQWSTLLVYLIANKLDPTTKKEWEESLKGNEVPDLSQLLDFLGQRCRTLESIDKTVTGCSATPRQNSVSNRFQRKHDNVRDNRTSVHAISNITCGYCRGTHALYSCENFLKLAPRDRLTEVRKLKICTNCLRSGHATNECKSSGCRVCNKHHNTRLHCDEENKRSNSESVPEPAESDTATDSQLKAYCTQDATASILLATALVYAFDASSNPILSRVLLDSASQSNFVTQSFIKRLGIPGHKVNMSVSGVGRMLSKISQCVKIKIKSRLNAYQGELSFLVVEQINENMPSASFDRNAINIPRNVTLADPDFHESRPVDMLIGAGIYYDLMCVGQIKAGIHGPIFQKTILGWIVGGSLARPPRHVTHAICNFTSSDMISQQIERFWKIEECTPEFKHTPEEMLCEQIFVENHTRDRDGHFTVTLPMNKNPFIIGDSLNNAMKRFFALERKFARDPDLKKKYCAFLEEYESLGHMCKIDAAHASSNAIFYLPHHSVSKETSATTKLRVVFDASAKGSLGNGLNDVLLVGPTIQEDLFSILIRFRTHNVVLIADVEKMYRQVWVSPSQRDLQRIVWRANPNDPLQHYTLKTVTYGTSPASFLAIRCLHQLAYEHSQMFPRASNAILKDMYVDDFISGANTIEEAIQLKHEVSIILSSGGFHLRKWMSNNREMLNEPNAAFEKLPAYYITDEVAVKTLGVLWNSNTDSFSFIAKDDSIAERRTTKRVMLSSVAKIFDPLGLLAPVTLCAKLMLQRLWQIQIAWDEAVPLEVDSNWKRFQAQLSNLENLAVPRQALCADGADIELHGFSDASEVAYGACLYARELRPAGVSRIVLLCGKSKVAPLKKITLPRLELCGALLLARLLAKTIKALNILPKKTVLWSDSTITLHWIGAQSNRWKTFVAHRVTEIQMLTKNCEWRHVGSSDNPADLISRGADVEVLLRSSLWWAGPAWLREHESSWPTAGKAIDCNIPEERKCVVSLALSTDTDIFTRYSNLHELQRVVAHCLRFTTNSRVAHSERRSGGLTVRELDDSLMKLIGVSQMQEFPEEISALRKGRPLGSTSSLLSLNPFLDQSGILHVGGRLSNCRVISTNQKFPIILPNKHALTRLIITAEHKRNLHLGLEGTLAAVRRRFWPIRGKVTVKGVLRHCIPCWRSKPFPVTHKMAPLPEFRSAPCRPFSNSGVDFAGPFLIRDGKLRNRKIIKAYLCLFICMASKAVHLEVVSDLSAGCFLNSLKRFVSRRGICSNLYSDNGTNLTGCNNELARDLQALLDFHKNDEVRNYLLTNAIVWHFIPARSPHFGGLWEAAIKSAKNIAKRVLDSSPLTFEGLYTVFTQIEAVLNSRPLYPLSQDPNDLLALTPGHFLIGEALTAIPQENTEALPSNRLVYHKQLQQMIQQFWSRWKREYLGHLQQRKKWKTDKAVQLEPGSMVLLRDENTPVMKWPLGRVVEVHPGVDGCIRVASVKTAGGVVRRAVVKLCVLPLPSNEQ